MLQVIVDISIAICIVLLLVNYILSLSDHVGYKAFTNANNIILLIMIISYIVSFIAKGIYGAKINEWFLNFAELAFILFYTCILARVQTYKRIRAKAKIDGSWNEKTRQDAKKIFTLH